MERYWALPLETQWVLKFLKKKIRFVLIFLKLLSIQVNLCQKLLFLHQLTHNMMTDCSLNYEFSTWKYTPFRNKRDNLWVWLFYSHFWGIFCQPYRYLSKTFGADGHFEVLNMSKSLLDQRLKAKTQIILFLFFSILEKKIMKIYDS